MRCMAYYRTNFRERCIGEVRHRPGPMSLP